MNQDAKKIVKISIIIFVSVFIFIYAFFVSKDLIFGVKITNVIINGSPAQSGVTMNNDILKISGNAKNATNISINGREISINQDGDFNETIALQIGYNILNMKAVDKFGHVDEKNFRLIGGFAEKAKL